MANYKMRITEYSLVVVRGTNCQRGRHSWIRNASLPGMRAFTLVELMVVVVIIGVLATVVTVSVTDYLVKGKQNAAKAEIAQISSALQLFYLDNDRFPDNDEGLEILRRKTPEHAQGLIQGDLLDPWGQPYVYVYPGVHGAFDLCSLGANRQEGGLGGDQDICGGGADIPRGTE